MASKAAMEGGVDAGSCSRETVLLGSFSFDTDSLLFLLPFSRVLVGMMTGFEGVGGDGENIFDVVADFLTSSFFAFGLVVLRSA